MRIFCKNRINIQIKNTELILDPEKFSDANCAFISHAHYDHLPRYRRKPKEIPPVVCSKATARLFQERIGYEINQFNDWENDFVKLETLPGGHTFDSRVAKITEKETGKVIVYTGDINIEDRAYLKGFSPIKCDVLILEATWGERNYQFPTFENQISIAREYIQRELKAGNPVAILGYPLGKAQLLNYSLGDLCERRFSTDSIWKMEQIHTKLGLTLHKTMKFNFEHIDNSEPWILFHNHTNANDKILKALKHQFKMKVTGFSGWAKNQQSYKIRMGADMGFIVSDHSDYNNLLKIIRECNPEKIFTVFGHANILAKELQKDGLNAVPLNKGQATLESYF